MPSIDNLTSLLNLLSQKTSSLSKKFSAKKGKSLGSLSDAESVAELKLFLSKQIQGINKDSKDYPENSRRVLIETAIKWQFGEFTFNDATNEVLINKVVKSILANDEIKQIIDQGIESLHSVKSS